MNPSPRPARVFVTRRNNCYVVTRILYLNSARNDWVILTGNMAGGQNYPTIRALKAVETPSLIASGFWPVTYR